MNLWIVFLVIWFVARLITSASKKKGGATKPGDNKQSTASNRQRQAMEEQKRRREAYEAAQRELARRQAQPRREQEDKPWRPWEAQQGDWLFMEENPEDIPPYRRVSAETLPAPVAPPERHHIDEEEEARCATAAQAKRSERELTRPQATPPAAKHRRPQTLVQAQKQLYGKRPPLKQTLTESAPSLSAAPSMQAGGLPLYKDALVQGIIMAEILGPPRAKRCRSQK